jgi:hypothetical protein
MRRGAFLNSAHCAECYTTCRAHSVVNAQPRDTDHPESHDARPNYNATRVSSD